MSEKMPVNHTKVVYILEELIIATEVYVIVYCYKPRMENAAWNRRREPERNVDRLWVVCERKRQEDGSLRSEKWVILGIPIINYML